MAEKDTTDSEKTEGDWPVYELWKEYEGITMHFNDLLIKLRTQALAGVAALSALVGIFARVEGDDVISWKMASLVFAFLIVFWIAIWIIDFLYYNRLLLGAVRALLDLEELSKTKERVSYISISTMIEKAVAGEIGVSENRKRDRTLSLGRWLFYSLVCAALIFGLLFSLYEWRTFGDSDASPVVVSKPQSSPTELEMQKLLCAGMEQNVPLEETSGGPAGRAPRVDCLSEDYAIEVDWTENWQGALGQALQYADLTNKRPGIILVCHKSDALCHRHALRLEETSSNLKIDLALWRCSITDKRLADCIRR